MSVQRLSGASSAAKLTNRAITWSSGLPTAVTETYSDGTVNVRTFMYDITYTPPRLIQTVDTSPARTEVYTYNSDGTIAAAAVS